MIEELLQALGVNPVGFFDRKLAAVRAGGPNAPDPADLLDVFAGRGAAARAKKDFAGARDAWLTCLELLDLADARSGPCPNNGMTRAMTNANLATLADTTGDADEAELRFQAAVEQARQTMETWGVTEDYLRETSVLVFAWAGSIERRGDFGRAQAKYAKALELRRDVSSRFGTRRSDVETRIVYLKAKARAARRQNDPAAEAETLQDAMECVYAIDGEFGETLDNFREGARLLERLIQIRTETGDLAAAAMFAETLAGVAEMAAGMKGAGPDDRATLERARQFVDRAGNARQ